jgi:RimJ/RimL family protein N-acetyltransferase
MEPQSDISPTGSEYRHVGEYCSVWPYVRGHFSRDFLYRLWTLIEAEHDWPSILWEYEPSTTPIDQHGDLVEWIYYMQSLLDPKALLMVQDQLSKEIAGLIWFYRQKEDSAHASIWISKRYRGTALTRDAVSMGLEYAFYARHWKTVYAVTPWAIARNLLKRCGFSQLASVPEYFGRDVHLMAIKEKDYGRKRRTEN